MTYKQLRSLYYQDGTAERKHNLERLLAERRDGEFGIVLNLGRDGEPFFFTTPPELAQMIEDILRMERKVSNLYRSMPSIIGAAVLRSMVLDEVVLSNAIENIHSTRKQIESALDSTSEISDLKSKRFREFALLYLNLADSEAPPINTPADIRHIYDRIMSQEDIDKPDGEVFRKDPAYVTNGIKVVHSGFSTEDKIRNGLQIMLDMVSDPQVPSLQGALASHFLFEYIHPFYDGNGRCGRYLLAVILASILSKATALSLSRVISENRNTYYSAFTDAEATLNHGELTFFIMDMCDLLRQAQNRLIEQFQTYIDIFNEIQTDMQTIESSGGYNGKELKIIFLLAQQAAFSYNESLTLDMLSSSIGLSAQQTRKKYLNALENRNVIKKTRGRDPMTFALESKFIKDHFHFQPKFELD